MNKKLFLKKIIFVFIISFLLNFIWENLHAYLYDNYMGGKITEFILLRATLGDAVMITFILLPFVFSKSLKKYSWTSIFIFLFIAILIEYCALGAGRWAYNSLMPVVPILGGIGLTPLVQLATLGYGTFRLEEYFFSPRT